MAITVSFDNINNAWTSFHSYEPEWMAKLGNNFYTFKNGNIYLHESETAPRAQFYGTNYGMHVEFSSNESPSDIKLFKALALETNSDQWYAELDSSQESGVIGTESYQRFEDKEDFKYAYIRRKTTDKLNFNEMSIVGIGEIQSIDAANSYTFSEQVITQVSTNGPDGLGGDELYVMDGTPQRIGVIDSVSLNTIITVSSDVTPSVGDFCFAVKDPSAESYGLKGYHATIKLTNKSTDFVELYASNSEVVKSFA